ncbi:hypothetical protein D3C85_1344850 [compost metagenome]
MKRSSWPSLPLRNTEVASPMMLASFRSDFFSMPPIQAGRMIQRLVSGTFCSSSTVPQSTTRSSTLVLLTATGVPATPRLIASDFAPAVAPALSACASA